VTTDQADDETLAEVEEGAAERLTFFSDAVVAIAMTLLALELPLPQGDTASELWHSAGQNFDAYLAFCLSFVVIASYWTSHHRLFRWIRRADDRLRWLNLWWLFFIVVMPFITRIISEGGDRPGDFTQPVRFAAYAAVQVLINLVYLMMALHLRRASLLRPVTPPAAVDNALWGAGMVAVGFALSIPLFFVISWAWVLWIVVPKGVGMIHGRLSRRGVVAGRQSVSAEAGQRGRPDADG
jgi:uncharacterized membrane protein